MFRSWIRQLFLRRSLPPFDRCAQFRPQLDSLDGRIVPTASVTIASLGDVTEGGSAGTFRLTRTETSGSLSVNVAYSGTATSGDYTNTLVVMFMNGQASTDITITPTNDSTSEPTETVICTVTSGYGYTVGSPASATMNRLDNDAQIVTVVLASDAAEDGGTGTVEFTRIGNLSSSLTVDYTVSGTATAEDDYEELSGQVTFAAGSATAEVVVDAVADQVLDPVETVVVTLSSGSGYSLGSLTVATVSILTTSLYTVPTESWFNLGGSGSNTGWLTIGDDGGVWFATGPENDMDFAGLATWDVSEEDAVAYLVDGDEEDAPEISDQPPEVAPPPRVRPDPGVLPPIVSPPGSVQVGAWYLKFNQDGTVDIENAAHTILAKVLPDGSVLIYANGTKIEIKAPPKSNP